MNLTDALTVLHTVKQTSEIPAIKEAIESVFAYLEKVFEGCLRATPVIAEELGAPPEAVMGMFQERLDAIRGK